MDYRDFLIQARRGLRLRRWIGSLLGSLAVLGIGVALLWTASFFTEPGGIAQSVLGLFYFAVALFVIIRRGIAPLFHKIPVESIIRAVEKEHPELKERLGTAFYLQSHASETEKYRFSPEMTERTTRWTEEQVNARHFEFLLSWQEIKPPAIVAAMVFATLLLMGWTHRGGLSNAWTGYLRAMGSERHAPIPVQILTCGDLEVPRGASAHVTAEISIPVPEAKIHYRSEDRPWETGEMQPVPGAVPGHFRFEVSSVRSAISYFVSSGNATSTLSRIRPVDPPRIEKFAFQVTPPAYTRLPAWREEQPEGKLEAPEGSRIEFTIRANNELASARIELFSGESQPLGLAGPREATGEILLNAPVSFRIGLKDRFGFESTGLGPYRLETRPDAPPKVFIHHPPLVSDLEDRPLVRLDWEAVDDYGLSRAELVYQLNYMNLLRRVPLARAAREADSAQGDLSSEVFEPTSSVRLRSAWDLSALGLIPGDEVTYYVVAWDNNALSGPQPATSEVHLLRLPTAMDLYEENQEQQVSYLDQFEDLIEQQRKIREEAEQIQEKVQQEQSPSSKSQGTPENESQHWQEQQKMEELKNDQENLGDQIQQLQQEIQQTLQNLNDPNAFSLKTLQKMAKIEELINQLLSEEMKQVLNQFNRVLEEMAEDQPADSLEELNFSIEDFEENLDRMLSLLENSMIEQQIEAMTKQIESLQQEQDVLEQQTGELQSEMEQTARDDSLSPEEKAEQQAEQAVSQEELAGRQEQLEEQMQQLLQQMQQLAQQQQGKNEKRSEGLKEAMKQAEEDQLSQALEEAKEQLKSGQMPQSRSAQKRASQAMAKLKENMASMMGGMGGSMDFAQDLQELRRNIDRALVLSDRQEAIGAKLAPGDEALRAWPDGLQNETNIFQRYFRDEALRVEKGLLELAKKDPFIDFQAIRELRLAARAQERAVQWSEEELPNQGRSSIPRVRGEVGLSLNHINLAISILLENLGDMAQAQSSSGMEGYFNNLQQLIGRQQQINIRTRQQQQQMRQQGQTPDWRQEMQRLAQEQAGVRRQIQELYRKYGKLEELLGNLDEVGNQMMDVEKDLEDQPVNEKIQEKQEQILTRMLDAEKSIQEQGFSKERQSETAGEYESGKSPELPETAQTIRNRIQKLQQGLGDAQAPPEYRDRVRLYFERLSREN